MIPYYENTSNRFEIVHKSSRYVSPHLHESIELVLVTEGELAIGQDAELYGMEKGDFAIIFPNMIHHYQVFSKETSTAWYILADSEYYGSFIPYMQGFQPENPVIKKDQLHPDIPLAMQRLSELHSDDASSSILKKSYFQIILGRSISQLHLIKQPSVAEHDLVYRIVYYIAMHYQESIDLKTMAYHLGCSPYTISRLFSSTFHKNFNQYLNEKRLEHAITLLVNTNMSITQIYLEAGFESQRTFNRVFSEEYHMTPREYRRSIS